MVDLHGPSASEPTDDAPWGIVCFPGDCMSPVIVFSYPPVEALASPADETQAS